MHVVFVEPRFPANQKNFIRALAECGVAVSAIGEGSKDSLDQELRRWLTHYESIQNVTNEQQLFDAVRFIQKHARVDRLEATVEAHIMPAAHVREKAGIPGTTARTAVLCRDKPAMKDVLRAGRRLVRRVHRRRVGRGSAGIRRARRIPHHPQAS